MSRLARVGDPNEYVDVLTEQDPVEGAWLRRELDGFWAGVEPYEYECVDNTRIADDGSDAERSAYEELASGGCCGFVDVRLGPSPTGTTYLYGFNHGH